MWQREEHPVLSSHTILLCEYGCPLIGLLVYFLIAEVPRLVKGHEPIWGGSDLFVPEAYDRLLRRVLFLSSLGKGLKELLLFIRQVLELPDRFERCFCD